MVIIQSDLRNQAFLLLSAHNIMKHLLTDPFMLPNFPWGDMELENMINYFWCKILDPLCDPFIILTRPDMTPFEGC